MERIGDHALIGDCRSAALVSRRGSIDWLCWPRFDSPSLFGALLDERAGHWTIAVRGDYRVERAYLEGTNVLCTRFVTPDGVLALTDLMPVASEAHKRAAMVPDHEIVRIAECESGQVELQMTFAPRPDYAAGPVRLSDAGRFGVRIEHPSGLLLLRSDAPCVQAGDRVMARAPLSAGQAVHFSLTLAVDCPAVAPVLGAPTRAALERSIAWWRRWIGRMRYDGPARAAVARSALALRLLVYAPSGAIVAAPTTSLPERIGGELNWDYRYCWLRDASLTVRALLGLGLAAESEAFVSWLLHSTLLTRPELQVLYDVHGGVPKAERRLDWSGHFGSRPVRIRNAAADQLQLDVYGEVIDATLRLVRAGERLDRETQRMLCDLGGYVCRHWREDDEGMWEPRTGRSAHTHSRLLCWTALDRLIELGDAGQLARVPAEFAEERERIRSEIERRGWNQRIGSYAAQLDGDDLDASLLLMPWYGFVPADSRRMCSTFDRIQERLGAGGGLLYRYRGGQEPVEGAFAACGFWAAEALALGCGSAEEAERTLLRLCGYANDVGLFAEEIDPATGQALGNFPQAFSHIALVNAALSVAERAAREAERGRQRDERRPARPRPDEAHP